MHREAWEFVKAVKAQSLEFFTNKTVLEVGSLNINGTVRDFFTDCRYTGIDLGEGKDVDVVVHLTDYHRVNDGEYDVVISAEALEHDHLWAKSLAVMYRLLKPGGLLLITAAGPNRPEHGTTRSPDEAIASPHTPDYYRNISVEDFASVLPASLWSRSHLGYRGQMEDLYFVGIKSPPRTPSIERPYEAVKVVGDEQGIMRPFDPIVEVAIDAYHQMLDKQKALPTLTVTAEVCTKDRYSTTLGLTLSAIMHQTHKPDKLVIYDDGEQKELRTLPPYDALLFMCEDLGIPFVTFKTERKGQVACHQHALDNATTDLIWRIDDDEIPEPNCLENLLAEMKDGVGAVGGLVHHPAGVVPLPDFVDGSLNDVTRGLNISWYEWDGAPREVAHLYSTFIFSVRAARDAGGYCKELSRAGHREETMFSHNIKRAGYKLIVTPAARTWHLRQNTGGIRTYSDGSLWEHDEVIFQEYLRTIGQVKNDQHLLILDSGNGDHNLVRGLLVDEFQRKYPDRKWLIACCWPEVFEDIPNVTIISIAEAKLIVGDKYLDYSLFEYGWHHGDGRHVLDVMREFYTKDFKDA